MQTGGQSHTGLTQDVGEGRAAASAAAGGGEHKQRGEASLRLSLTLRVLLEIMNTGSTECGSRSLLSLGPEISRVLLLSVASPSRSVELPRILRGLLGGRPITYLQDRRAGSTWPVLGLMGIS